jgi:hypothetical protein
MASLWVEDGEWVTAEPWTNFGEQQRSKERVRARRSELALVSSLQPLFWRESERKERVDASTASRASPWRSCARWKLTSGVVLSPVGELDFDSVKAMIV